MTRARERRITDGELLGKAKNTLIRAFGLGNYRTVDNDSFNNLLYELAQDLIKDRTTAGFVGQLIKSFASFAQLTSDVQLLAQQTSMNSSGTKVSIEYVPETSVEWPGQMKSKLQHRTHVTRDEGYDTFTPGTTPPDFFDLGDLDVLEGLQDDGPFDEEQGNHDRFYMSQDQRQVLRHRSNAPARHARTDTSQTRRPHFQRERALPSVNTWDVGRKTDLRQRIDGRQVDPDSRILHLSLRQSPTYSHAPDLSDVSPHRPFSSTSVSFKPGGSLSRHIDTKLPIRELLERMVEVKRRLAGCRSMAPGEKERLFDNVVKVVHEVLYSAYRQSGVPDSDDEEDPVTDGAEFEAFVTDLHQPGRQA